MYTKELVLHTCLACGGDGRETCDNPDHGFISGIGGEISRLGCPVCGYDEDHKVKYWNSQLSKYQYGTCHYCKGTGEMSSNQLKEYQKDYA